MAKKSIYFCSECGHENYGWLGKCPACNSWNTMVESTKLTKETAKTKTNIAQKALGSWLTHTDKDSLGTVFDLATIDEKLTRRKGSGIPELDHVLGGGFVEGSLVLLGGSPGMGKSTLLLQVCQNLLASEKIVYICGEESPSQIKLRANRLGLSGQGLTLLTETSFEKIAHFLEDFRPSFVIVDSIQTIYMESLPAAPGTITQIRDTAFGFLRLAKALNITICLVGHVTKDGQLAGPRILEHMVDTVLYFDGDTGNNIRIVRTVKNRFGSTDEIGMFEMSTKGLLTIGTPSKFLLNGRPKNTAGTAITAGIEGSRSYLLEVQALLSESNFVSPQRMTQGIERAKLSMIIAIIEKSLNFKIGLKDAYLNVVGGIRLNDPAADLAIATALISSYKNTPIQKEAIVLGELGLTGEVRPISAPEKRIAEAALMGIKTVFLPGSLKNSLKAKKSTYDVEIIFIDNLKELVDIAF